MRLTLAIMTDMHVGSTITNRWHNRFLSDQPEETAVHTVAAINARNPDLVLVLGDLSDTATSPQLHRARGVLESLKAPWVACRGNHDRPPESPPSPPTNGSEALTLVQEIVEHVHPPDTSEVADTWDRWLGMHAVIGLVPPDTAPLPEGVVLVVFDADWWTADDGIFRVAIDDEQINAIEAALDAAPRKPDLLIVACHFPFVRQTEHLRQMAPDAKNAGTLQDGQVIIDRLAPLAHRSLWFCGHQHFHQIVCSPDAGDLPQWLHCTTASLAEFPAEYRLVTIAATSVTIHTETAVPDLLHAKPPRTSWVRGREQDREFVWETGDRS